MASGPRIERTDIGLLQVFCAVVEAGGFTPAQAELGIGASSLSTKMSTLESRLGVKLCQRGRIGFRMTDEGRRVYAAAKDLFAAYREFEAEVGTLRDQIVGELHLALMDHTISNPDARIHQAIARFLERPSAVEIRMEVVEPARIERGLLEGRFHVGIAAFYQHVPGLAYEPLFRERQVLYCGAGHALAQVPAAALTREAIARADYVARSYMGPRAAAPIITMNARAWAFDMESIARLILTGRFIGYLPAHYAAAWAASGEMLALLPDELGYDSRFELATRRGSPQSRTVKAFLQDLRAEMRGRPAKRKRGAS